MSDNADSSFFSRWSRRKLDERAGKPLAEPTQPLKPAPPPVALTPSSQEKSEGQLAPSAQGTQGAPSSIEPASTADIKLPTLQDTQALTPQSDFKPFMAQGVAPEVKNAAMKKLFADPHFNVMDRMDTYIDDYSLPDPLPESMLRKMASAKFLNLFDDDEEKDADKGTVPPDAAASLAPADDPALHVARDVPNAPACEVVAQSAPDFEALPAAITHDHPDMRLQPDDALEPKGTGRGAA